MNDKTNWKAPALVFLAAGLEFALGPGLLQLLNARGVPLYSVSAASRYPLQLLLQWGILCLSPAILFFATHAWRKQTFQTDMYLKIHGKRQLILVGALTVFLLVLAAIAIGKTGDPLLVILSLFHYLVVVAFAEEFLFRGLCPFLLRNFSKPVIYLLPSLLFALLHFFAYQQFGALNFSLFLRFLSNDMLGLLFSGLCFQFLKDRSGTLWVPILLHAALDFSAVLT